MAYNYQPTISKHICRMFTVAGKSGAGLPLGILNQDPCSVNQLESKEGYDQHIIHGPVTKS
jgi:hypothetical protein